VAVLTAVFIVTAGVSAMESSTILKILRFGKREKFLNSKSDFGDTIVKDIENTYQYHDGKWIWIDVRGTEHIEDIKKLILIKRKPKKKP
jgi:hypothetical protein